MAFRLEVGQSVTIGRDLTSDIPVLDAGVSRHHATIALERENDGEEALWLEDLHSHNGTFVNTERARRTKIHPGDVITIGRIPLTLTERRLVDEDWADPLQRLAQERLTTLLRLTHGLAAEPEKPMILQRLLELGLEALDAERGSVLLWEEERNVFHPVAASPQSLFQEIGRLVDKGLGDTILRGGKARILWSTAPSAEKELELVRSSRAQAPSAIATPLLAGMKEVGILYLDRTTQAQGFEAADVDFLQALAWVANTALGTSSQLSDMRDWNERLESLLSQRAIHLEHVEKRVAPEPATGDLTELLRKLEESIETRLTAPEEGSEDESQHAVRLESGLRSARLHLRAVRRLCERRSARFEEVQVALALKDAADRRPELANRPLKVEDTLSVICPPDELDLALDLALDAVLCDPAGPSREDSPLECVVASTAGSSDVLLRVALSGEAAAALESSGPDSRALALDLLERLVKERLHGSVTREAGGARLEIRMPKASFTLQETADLPVPGASRVAAVLSGDA